MRLRHGAAAARREEDGDSDKASPVVGPGPIGACANAAGPPLQLPTQDCSNSAPTARCSRIVHCTRTCLWLLSTRCSDRLRSHCFAKPTGEQTVVFLVPRSLPTRAPVHRAAPLRAARPVDRLRHSAVALEVASASRTSYFGCSALAARAQARAGSRSAVRGPLARRYDA